MQHMPSTDVRLILKKEKKCEDEILDDRRGIEQ